MKPRPASLLKQDLHRSSPRLGGFLLALSMYPRIEIPAEKRQKAYELYACRPECSLKDIQAELGVSASTFVRLRQRWGWLPRQAALAENELSKAETHPGDAPAQAMAATTSLREAARSLARATRAQINALMEEQRAGLATDHDKIARTLASYAKTLTAAQALLEQEGPTLDDTEQHDTKPRRSLHELRDELARHLDRVVAEEEARGRDGLLV
jgi:hypothetical protein